MAELLPILDTHQHLIYPEQWPYSWTGGVAALVGKAFRYEDYLAAAAGTGIAKTLFMETSPDDPHWKNEARFVSSLAAKKDCLIGGIIANCRPEDDDFPAYLDSLDGFPVRGLRRILHVAPGEPAKRPIFAENLRRLAKRNLTFDLCVFARQIPMAIDLIRQCPDVQFVLDHCGNPDISADGGKGPATDWRQWIQQIAAHPNVACKISGIVANCKPGTVTTDLLRPYVEHCLTTFGWNRVAWGSDWPVCLTNCSLNDWAGHTRLIVAAADVADQRKLFWENAGRIYRAA